MSTLQSVVQDYIDARSPSEVEELLLEGWRGSELSAADQALLETFTALQFLSLSGCGLKSLVRFPALPSLLKLDLNDNKVAGGLELLAVAPKLVTLNLAGNQVKSIEDLKPLVIDTQTALPQLAALDLYGCPVTTMPGYREAVLQALPALEVLDEMNREGVEVSESDSEAGYYDFEEDGTDSDDGDKSACVIQRDELTGRATVTEVYSSEEETAPEKKRRS